MRLDKFLAAAGVCSRRESAALIRSGAVCVGGQPARSGSQPFDPENETAAVDGNKIVYRKYRYVMLNKPEGVVSATEDSREKTVLDLFPEEYRRAELFPCGRLDKNTSGLLLLTNDGKLSHRLLAPKRGIEKEYRFQTKFPVSDEDLQTLSQGVEIETGYRTKPCLARRTGEKEGYLTLTEGKYHEVKLMLKAVHNQVTFLERVRFGGLRLDETLPRGGFRELTAEETALLRKTAGLAESGQTE